MELPAALRHAVDQALDGIALGDLTAAAERLSRRYRAEIRDGRFHLSDDLAALAYLTTRLPATYAAIRAALSMVTERLPDLRPSRQLDLGAGPGTAFWAARDCWPDLGSAILLEGSAAIRRQGELLMARAVDAKGDAPPQVTWIDADLARLDGGAVSALGSSDLVSLCYVLDELSPEARHRLIEAAWSQCTGLLLIVEPGTPAGWRRILAARDQLLAADARMVAPCPHALPCPLLAPLLPPLLPGQSAPQPVAAASEEWCHFSRRVARSRLHRLAKQADVPWEDEKFIFIAVARPAVMQAAAPAAEARLITPARGGSGRLQLRLCESDGEVHDRLITKRDGDLYRRARRLDWGDTLKRDR
jgi:ribosomal protein RSM22 (predicted rRNA methylase)